MRKLFLATCASFLGMALFVKAEIPAVVTESLTTLTTQIEALVVQDIASETEREALAQKLELDVALAVGSLNELAVANNIEMKDAVEVTQSYASLWGLLSDWKINGPTT